MKNILFGINDLQTQQIQLSNLKNKLSSTIKPKSNWIIITDKFPINTEIKTSVDFNRYISSKDKFIYSMIVSARNKKISIIGIGVDDDIYKKEGKLDDDGKCIDCRVVIHKIEANYKKIIETNLNIGNVFVVLDDTHLRTRATKEYGQRSKLFYNDSKFQIIRPSKKNIL